MPILPDDVSEENKLEAVRNERNSKLSDTDWAVLPDAPLTDAEKTEVKDYRQSLRDLPQQINDGTIDPYVDDWPTKPDVL